MRSVYNDYLTLLIRTPGNFLEVTSASQARRHLLNLPKDTIIFIDIDDTIIIPVSNTFRAPPYNKLIENIKKNREKYEDYQEIISNWRLQRKIRLIDNHWPSVLKKLKEKFKVYGLTKTDTGKFGNISSMEKWRSQELKSLGIHFSNNPKIPQQQLHGASFYRGIFITGINTKGQTISHYLSHFKTTTIVMVDDRLEHLEDIQQFCQMNSIKFIGLLFNGIKKFRAKPNPAIARFQKQYLIKHAQWLEDKEAGKIMKKLGSI